MALFQHHVRDVLEVTEVGPRWFPRPVHQLLTLLMGLGFLPGQSGHGVPAAAAATLGILQTQ
jgi:hypothetical protein